MQKWYRNIGGDGLKTPVVDAVFLVSPECCQIPEGLGGSCIPDVVNDD